MPSRLYEINHPYSLARALLAAVKKAVAAGDEEVMGPLRPVIMQLKNAALVNNG